MSNNTVVAAIVPAGVKHADAGPLQNSGIPAAALIAYYTLLENYGADFGRAWTHAAKPDKTYSVQVYNRKIANRVRELANISAHYGLNDRQYQLLIKIFDYQFTGELSYTR